MIIFIKERDPHITGDLPKEVEKVAKMVLWSALNNRIYVHAKYRRKIFIPISEFSQGRCIPYIILLYMQKA